MLSGIKLKCLPPGERAFVHAMLVIGLQAYELLALKEQKQLLLLFFRASVFFECVQHNFICDRVIAGDQVTEKRQL